MSKRAALFIIWFHISIPAKAGISLPPPQQCLSFPRKWEPPLIQIKRFHQRWLESPFLPQQHLSTDSYRFSRKREPTTNQVVISYQRKLESPFLSQQHLSTDSYRFSRKREPTYDLWLVFSPSTCNTNHRKGNDFI